MKTNKLFFAFAAMVTLAAVSCNKEELTGPEFETSAVEFTATAETPVTRTAIDETSGTVTWTAGDQVAFYWEVDGADHSTDQIAYPYVSEALAEAGAEAKFTIANAAETFVNAFIRNQKTETSRRLYAIYPATVTSSFFRDAEHTSLDVTVPTVQDGSFRNASIALAKWSSADPTSLSFHNLCALLKVNVTDENVKKVVIKSDSDIAGTVNLTFKLNGENVDYPLVHKMVEAAKSVTVEVAAPGTYYVAVLPTAIENLYVEYQNAEGTAIAGQTAGRTINAERANIYALPTVTAPADKYFVKADGQGDGSSWDNAASIASMFTMMKTSDVTYTKIYMAAGTYTPTEQFSGMKKGFDIYGGYPATASGYDLTGRNVATNATIIDGGWDGESKTLNLRLFVLQTGDWVFDGVTFQNVRYAGNSNGSAIQLIYKEADAKIVNAVLRNCKFKNCVNANASYLGGAVRVDVNNTLTMESCTFEDNSANSGGAIWVAGNLNAVSCDFVKNTAAVNGGAIVADGAAVVKLDKCEFSQNAANGTGTSDGGGAVYMEAESTAKLFVNRCSFVKNTDAYNAHHIYTRSTNNHVGINNSVFRGPYGVKTTAGGLVQLKGQSVIVNTTMYCRTTSWGAISLGSKTENGCRIVNSIILNNSSNSLSFYTTNGYSASVYNSIYTASLAAEDQAGTIAFTDCLSGAYAKTTGDNTANFPTTDNLWSANSELGTKFQYEDGRSFYAYAWEGTTDAGTVVMNNLANIKTLISGTAAIGSEYLSWLESDALKVNGVEALAVDIRGEKRDTDKMWPGSYQAPLTVSESGASVENFNVK